MVKKIYIALSLIAGLMVSCDPVIEEAPGMTPNKTAEQLQSSVTLTQTVANQNKFTFSTNPATTVQVLDQDGNILASGTTGSIIGVPPLKSLTVRSMNQDGSITSYSQDFTISEYVDVPEIYKNLFGADYTSQTWVWDVDAADGVFGNGGYMSNTGPGWWVIKADGLNEQATGKNFPDDTIEKGWMTFTLAGKKVSTSRGENGSLSWDLSAVAKEGWDFGTLTFTGTVPLLGIQPNSANAREYNYHIIQMDGKHLRLCAPEAGSGEGGTAWFWNFKTKE